MRLAGKTAFITGGTSGIGLATAEAFVREGAKVAITGRNRQRLDTALAALGGDAIGFEADAGDDGGDGRGARCHCGPVGGLDIVFANAGHYVHSALGSTTRKDLESQLSVVANIFMTVQLTPRAGAWIRRSARLR